MPRVREWDDDAGDWRTRFTCRYCFDDAESTGPLGRGSTDVALARIDAQPFVFCSPACRDRWVSVVTAGTRVDSRDVRVADDVPADTLR